MPSRPRGNSAGSEGTNLTIAYKFSRISVQKRRFTFTKIPRQSPGAGDDVRDGGHGSVGPVAAHDAVEEGRAPARRKPRPAAGGEPRSAARAAAAAGDKLGVVEAVRAGNVEVVVLESVVVIIIIFFVVFVVVSLIPDHENIRTEKIILDEKLRDFF